MNTLHITLFATLAGPSAHAPLAGRGLDEVVLRPRSEPAVTLTRTIERRSEWNGSDLTVSMDGQEVPQEYLPDLTLDIVSEQALEVLDVRRERALDRTFVALSQEARVALDLGGYMGQQGEEFEATAASPLEGRAVQFSFGEGDACEARFVDAPESARPKEAQDAGVRASEAKLLAGLRPGLDLAGWLPSDSVAVGARWEAPAAALGEAIDPCGELAWQWSRPDADGRVDSSEIAGDVALEFVALAEVDGRALAELRVSGTFVLTTKRATDLADVPVADGTATETRAVNHTLSGQILWDVAGGHLSSAELTSDIDGLASTVKDAGQEGPDYASTMRFTGREVWHLATSRER
ncbi:MAG: hypothetical protein R3F49_09315 [Planctomycetota bacterium]